MSITTSHEYRLAALAAARREQKAAQREVDAAMARLADAKEEVMVAHRAAGRDQEQATR